MACKKSCESVSNPCEQKVIATSQICYDGWDLPGLCIKNGMNLNDILQRIDDAVMRLEQASVELTSETFTSWEHDGKYYLELSSTPYRIIQVSYCGSIFPTSGYTLNGKRLNLNTQYCGVVDGEGHPFIVMYQKQYDGGCL